MATPQVTTRILRRLLASGVDTRAERLLARMPPADIAPLLSGLTRDEVTTVVDLLANGALRASEIKRSYDAPLSKASYLALMRGMLHEERWSE